MKGKRNEKRSKKSAILKQHARNLFVGVVIVLFVVCRLVHFLFPQRKRIRRITKVLISIIKVLRLKFIREKIL